jgi:hypothetical protein
VKENIQLQTKTKRHKQHANNAKQQLNKTQTKTSKQQRGNDTQHSA